MMIDTRVYGFAGDGFMVHADDDCAPDVKMMPDGRYVSVALRTWPAVARESVELRPIFSLDDDGHGFSCDTCGEYIFEPSCPECGADTSTDDQGEPELCESCLESARELAEDYGIYDAGRPAQYASDKYRAAFDDRVAELVRSRTGHDERSVSVNLHTPAAGCGMFDIPTPTNAEHERHYNADQDRSPLDDIAWPGGYPIVYYAEDGDAFCGRHAWAVIVREDAPFVGHEIHYEGPPEWCAEGSHDIPSAYGEPGLELSEGIMEEGA